STGPSAAGLLAASAAAPGGDQTAAEAATADGKRDIKADAKKAEAKDDANPPSQAEPEVAAETEIAALGKHAGDDGDARNKDGKTWDHEIRHAAAKQDADKPEAQSRDTHRAEISAATKPDAANGQGSIAGSTAANADAAAAASAQAATPTA